MARLKPRREADQVPSSFESNGRGPKLKHRREADRPLSEESNDRRSPKLKLRREADRPRSENSSDRRGPNLKPRRESDRPRSGDSSDSRGPSLKPRRESDRPPSGESTGRRGSTFKPRREADRLPSGETTGHRRDTNQSHRQSRNVRGTIPVGKLNHFKDTSKEFTRRTSKDRDVLSTLSTVKKWTTKYETSSSYNKENSHEEPPKWKNKRITGIDSNHALKDRKLSSSFSDKTVKKKASDGKENSLDDQPKKKKKWVMRLDPHDISNKRLDDSPATPNSVEEKKKDSNESELSQNALFRAINPTPSILSYVEDNLLGRRRSIELKRAGYNIDLSVPLDNIPFSTSSDRERIEEPVFRNKLTFFAAAKVSSSFPPSDAPEVAFAGRSNVGKSSLLNALTRQWGVVRTSDKPGLTQTINFFQLGPKLRLVDLPGYGFAYAKEEVKDAWEELVKEYVSTRDGLKQVCLLIDTKWGMKPRDQELINIMERSQTKYQIVLTKTDTVFPIDVARRAWQIEDALKVNKSVVHPMMMVSAKSGAGIRCLRTALSKVARFAKI